MLSRFTYRVPFPSPPKESPLQGSPFGMGKGTPLERGLVGFIRNLNRINPLVDSTIRLTTVDLLICLPTAF